MDDLISVIKAQFPNKATDIFESLDLLKETLSETMDEINEKMTKYYKERNFGKRNEINEIIMKIYSYEKMLEEILLKLEYEEIEEEDQNDKKKPFIPNYEDYYVDQNVEYDLYQNLKHKRPYGFRMDNDEIIRIDTWRDMFVKTCEIFLEFDEGKFMSFEHNKKMNGRKVKYFSTSKEGMLNPILVNEKIFVEGHGSSNGHRNRVLKILNAFNYSIDKYKIYLRADYSEMRR